MGIACALYGPTAVGKSSFAEHCAAHLPCEIINCDAAQLYTPLCIGVAKTDWRASTVPHHMFDICDEPVDYSIAAYRQRVEMLVQEIIARGNVPLFVGGSGFYMHSLFFPVAPQAVQCEIAHAYKSASWEHLQRIDPIRAAQIHPHDTYRIQRALTLYQQTDAAPSRFKPTFCPITPCAFVELIRTEDDLKRRIAERITAMIDAGWVAEVESLLDTPWETFLLRKKWIGYPELIAYCRAGKPQAQLPLIMSDIGKRTWHYARKQMAYARMFIKKLHAHDAQMPIMRFDLTSECEEVYLKQLITVFNHLQKGLCNE